MIKKIILWGFIVSIISGYALAGNFVTKQISYPHDDIELLVANVDLAAGHFNIATADIPEIVKAEVEYDDRRVEIYSDYRKKRNTGYLEIGSDLLSKTHIDSENNRWEMTLSKKYKTDLSIDIGACKSQLDLGGIPLVYFRMDVGAADANIIFSEPNPEIAENISIDVGASSFEGEKFGNANFKDMVFDGGVGKFKLDFSGEYKTKSRAEISIGLGKAIIYIPSELPVRIEAEDNFLSSVKFKNVSRYEVDNEYFESRDFESSPIGLDMKIDVGLGSVEIIWVD
jgi:hypothetical protein